METKSKVIHTRVTDSDYKILSDESIKRGLPVSQLVRMIIRESLSIFTENRIKKD